MPVWTCGPVDPWTAHEGGGAGRPPPPFASLTTSHHNPPQPTSHVLCLPFPISSHSPPFDPISTHFPPFPPISPIFTIFPDFQKSWFGELVSLVAGSADACPKDRPGGVHCCFRGLGALSGIQDPPHAGGVHAAVGPALPALRHPRSGRPRATSADPAVPPGHPEVPSA